MCNKCKSKNLNVLNVILFISKLLFILLCDNKEITIYLLLHLNVVSERAFTMRYCQYYLSIPKMSEFNFILTHQLAKSISREPRRVY